MANKITIEVTAKDMASNVLKSVSGQMRDVGGASSVAGGLLSKFGGFLSGVLQTALGFITANVFTNITSQITDFGKKAFTAGADLQMLKIATMQLAENAGISAEQVHDMVEELADTNTFGSNAYQTIQTMIQSGLMPFVKNLKATRKETGETLEGFNAFNLSVKDMAAAFRRSSGEAIESMTKFVATGRSEMVEAYGINKNLTVVYEEYAATLGKAAQDLTETEKSQARLNLVMEEASKYAGTYDETYKTTGKNLLSIKDAAESLQEELGLLMSENGFAGVTKTILNAIKSTRNLITENETVRGTMARISETVSGQLLGAFEKISEGFSRVMENEQVQELLSNILDLLMGIGEFILNTIVDAIESFNKVLIDLSPYLNELWEVFAGIVDELVNQGVDDAIKSVGDEMRGAFTENLKGLISTIAAEARGFLEWLKTPEGQAAVEQWKKDLNTIKDIAISLSTALMGIATAIITVISWWTKLTATARAGTPTPSVKTDNTKVQVSSNAFQSTRNLTMMNASGTNYFRGGQTWVGEKGPELVTLPKGSRIDSYGDSQAMSKKNGITININGANNPMAIAREVERLLARHNQSARLGLNLGV